MAFSTVEDVAVALRSGLPISERDGACGRFDVLVPGRYELSAIIRSGKVYDSRGRFFGWKEPLEPTPQAPPLLICDFEVKVVLAVHRARQAPVDDSRYLASTLGVIDHRGHNDDRPDFFTRMRGDVPTLTGRALGCSIVPAFGRDAYKSAYDWHEKVVNPEDGSSSAPQSAALLHLFREKGEEPRKLVDLSFSPPHEIKRCDLDQLVVAAVTPIFDAKYPRPIGGVYVRVPEGVTYARAH